MINKKIIRGWMIACLVLLAILTGGVVIPNLFNSHNDWALAGAFLWGGGIITLIYTCIQHLKGNNS